MKRLVIIILVSFIVGCNTEPTTDYCEQATLLEYITYDGQVNRAHFQTNDREYYIDIDPETGMELTEGETYTVCFDEDNNFKSIS